MKRIATHSKPDADAIAAAWLAEIFLFPGEDVEVLFVPRLRPGQTGPAADCLVDVGCAIDPERLIFDHKGPAFADRNATCATRLVWEHLLTLGRPIRHLEALVRVVHEGDRSPPGRPSPELATSRSEGFHFHLKQARSQVGDDLQLYKEMRGWLDRYDGEERAKSQFVRTPSPNGDSWTRADVKPLNASVGIGVPQAMTSVSSGEAGVKTTARPPESWTHAPSPPIIAHSEFLDRDGSGARRRRNPDRGDERLTS